MISSTKYPCVIQEFAGRQPLDTNPRSNRVFAAKERALNNLNSVHLRGSSIGRYVASYLGHPPTARRWAVVDTWEQTGSTGKHRHWSPEVDANCNNPEERCRSCLHPPAPGTRCLSPPSTPSSSSPVSSCSDTSPNAVCPGESAGSEPAVSGRSSPSPGSGLPPELAKVGGTSPDSRSIKPGPDRESEAEVTNAGSVPGGEAESSAGSPVKPHADVNQNIGPAPQVMGYRSTGQQDPGVSCKPPASRAAPPEGSPGSLAPPQSEPPSPPFDTEALSQLAGGIPTPDQVSGGRGRTQVTLSPFDGPPRPLPPTRPEGTQLTTLEDAPISTGRGPERPPLRLGVKAATQGPVARNVTSFHELARKRRQIAAGHWAAKVKEDKSDWLMAFSPDTELPPPSPPFASTQERGIAGPRPQAPGKTRSQQKEVVTFRELRYRSQVDRWNLPPGRSDAPGRSVAARASAQRERHGEPGRLEAGGQGPRPAGVKVPKEEEEDGGQSVNGKSWPAQAGEVSDGPDTRQLRRQSLFNKAQGCNAGGQTRDAEGSPATGDVPLTEGFARSGQAEGQAEEAAHSGGGNGKARGKADGRDKSIKEVGRSCSFPGRSRMEWCRMAASVTAPSLHKPLLGGSVPSMSPQHKKGLLWAVNVSVDKIVSHFSVTRNIVQKAQLGDSRANPSVGHLVLGDLCPALYAVLRDGLKPQQQDLIVGRRPNSPWCVVEASVKAGPSSRILYSLCCKIYQLSQLSNSEKKFNAFIFGLLNHKHLDFWISHLHGCTEVLRTHYAPTAFLSLSHSSCRPLFEELLLLLQPLSVFTFHLDPLFEDHRQFLVVQGCVGSDPGGPQGPVREERGPPPGLDGKWELENGHRCGAQNGQLTDGGAAGQREELGKGARQKPLARGASNQAQEVNRQGQAKVEERTNRDAEPAEGVTVKGQQVAKPEPGHQEGKEESGYTLQQTFDQVVQWSDRLAQTLAELKKPPAAVPQLKPRPLETALGEKRKFSWWEQLGQSSQVYLSPPQEGSAFAKWMKPKAAGSKTSSLFELIIRGPAAASQGSERSPLAQDCSGKVNKPGSPLPNSEGEGVNTDCTDPIGPISPKDSANGSDDGQGDPMLCSGDPPDQLEEGSPPAASPDRRPASFMGGPRMEGLNRRPLPRAGARLWLGRLFGARVPSTCSPDDQPRQEAKPHPGRLPSDWLQVNINLFDQLLKSSPVRKDRLPPPLEIITQSQEPSKSARTVRTLCDHTATDKDHLSFKRGETLEIVACVDEDWIRCCHGDTSGLVPIGYTSLI